MTLFCTEDIWYSFISTVGRTLSCYDMLIYILEKDSNPKLNLPYTYVGLYVGFTVLIDLYNVRTHSLLKQTVKQAAEIIMKKVL
jgi:hypothetical protein